MAPAGPLRRRGTRLKDIITKAANAAIVLVCHFVLAALLIISFHYLERLIQFLGGNEVERVFGLFPLSYLFQAVDIAMIGLFGFMGLKEAYEVLK